MFDYPSLLASLKKIRKQKKLPHEDMAQKFNLGKDAYRKMESGTSPISLVRMIELCEILEVDLRDLLDSTLETKPHWEYEAEIARLEAATIELQIERERLWGVLNKLIRLLDPETTDEVYRLMHSYE